MYCIVFLPAPIPADADDPCDAFLGGLLGQEGQSLLEGGAKHSHHLNEDER
jgi:hypothetical protein